MAAMLIEIKSRMLLPPKKVAEGEEAEDPRAELVRRLIEYEQMKLAAARLNALPQFGRDFLKAEVYIEQSLQPRFPEVELTDLQDAWRDILKRAKLNNTTKSLGKNSRCASTWAWCSKNCRVDALWGSKICLTPPVARPCWW